MEEKELKEKIDMHYKWLNSDGGERADLSGAYLIGANLSGADLSGGYLSEANLSGANLNGAYLIGADLSGADLSGGYLSEANLSGANLNGADLIGADLSGADLNGANLSGANLNGADLNGADLIGADLSEANLSKTDGLLNQTKWLLNSFEQDDKGIIVYKAIGNTHYSPPDSWKFEAGEFLEEVVNPLPTVTCGCGVNFATLGWIENEFRKPLAIWKCRINWIDLATVVVPYNTDGKARCGRLELLEIVK